MWPYVIREPIEIGTYGVMMAIGFLTASWWLGIELRRRHINPAAGDMTVMLGIILGVVGSKLAYLLTEAETFSWVDFVSGAGLTWHGGLILASAGIIGYWASKKYPLPVMLDAVSPMLASGYAFGRLGCLISGDGCYGIPCTPESLDRFMCMAFPNGIVPTPPGVVVHPTPMYESISNFILAGVLWKLRKRFKHPGILFAIYLVWSGFSRFLVEFIRRSDGRPDRFLGLRDAHLIALAQVLLAVIVVAWAMYRSLPKTQEYGVMPAPATPSAAKDRGGKKKKKSRK